VGVENGVDMQSFMRRAGYCKAMLEFTLPRIRADVIWRFD